MRTKAPPPSQSFPEPLSPLLAALVELSQLKHLYRQGWLRRGLSPEKCESVADHSFATALLALLLADHLPPPLDRLKLLQLALLHDAGEVHAGDITPADGILADEKKKREREGAAKVFGRLPNAAHWLELWEEYAAGTSPEARLVRELDRLEMALQAAIYHRSEGLAIDDFLTAADSHITTPAIRELFEELRPH